MENLTPEITFVLQMKDTGHSQGGHSWSQHRAGASGAGGKSYSTAIIALNPDKAGLLFRIEVEGRKLSRIESLLDGRVLLWAEILGFEITEGVSEEGSVQFTLFSTEEEIRLEYTAAHIAGGDSAQAAVARWLLSVRGVIAFAAIVPPSASNAGVTLGSNTPFSPSTGGGMADFRVNSNIPSTRSSMTGLGGFLSMNSGAVFSCSGDVAIFLENMKGCELVTRHRFECVSRLFRRLSDLFQLAAEVQHNREAVRLLGDRLEDLVRVLGDSRVGALVRYAAANNCSVVPEDLDALSAAITRLDDRLLELVAYMHVNFNDVGWLLAALKNSTQLRPDLERFDSAIAQLGDEVVALVAKNRGSRGIDSSGQAPLSSERREFGVVVEVRRCMDDLCSSAAHALSPSSASSSGMDSPSNSNSGLFDNIEIILQDTAKVKAFARLTQSDVVAVQSELTLLHRHRDIFQADFNDVAAAGGRADSITGTIVNNFQQFLRSAGGSASASGREGSEAGSERSSADVMGPLSDASNGNNSSLFSRTSQHSRTESATRPWWSGVVYCCVCMFPICLKNGAGDRSSTGSHGSDNGNGNTRGNGAAHSGNKGFSAPIRVGGPSSVPYYKEPLISPRSLDSSSML